MPSTSQLSLNLTVDEINLILDALGQRPYAEVFQLVGKIQAQAEAQLPGREFTEQRRDTAE